MKFRIGMCVLLTCVSAALFAAPQAGTHQIMVTVLDKKGVALRDLTAADFTVSEDGKSRVIESAALSTEPLAVAMMIDMSRVGAVDLPTRDIRVGMSSLAKAIFADNPASKVSLMDYSGAAVTTVKMTSNGDEVLQATGRLTTSQRTFGVLLEGLLDVASEFAKEETPRRAIVAVSFDGPEASRKQPRDVAIAVQATGASFWAVSLGKDTASLRDVMFESLPPVTGGMRFTGLETTGLEKILTNVGTALTSQYVITYKRPDGASAGVIEAGAKKGAKVLRASWMR